MVISLTDTSIVLSSRLVPIEHSEASNRKWKPSVVEEVVDQQFPLEETAALDGNGQGPAIPIKHRRDQSVLPFLQARQEGKESSSKMCSGM